MNRSWLRPLLGAGFGAILLLASASPALAIPAFARKTGLRCGSCHESWPVLNDFGRSYRDNGYQLRLGKDDPTTTTPGYWPVAIRITPHYEYTSLTHQLTDQGTKTLSTGGVADAAMDLLVAGTLAPNASYLVVPTGFASDGAVNLESYWVYLTRLFFHSDWFNVRIGQHEVDLPASAHRSINLTSPYLVYSHHPGPDSAAAVFDLGTNQRGIEITGHNRGSMMRYNLTIATANDTSGSRNGWDSPYYYGHIQKYWQLDSNVLSEVEVGAFGAYAYYPTTSLTSGGGTPIPGQGGDLKLSSRYGAEAQFWLGPLATPLHFSLVYARGKDNRDLYGTILGVPVADRDGEWNGGFLEVIWVPSRDLLHWGLFGRYDIIRNTTQPLSTDPKSLNDQDQLTAGIKYTINYNNRAEYALHAEYSSNRMKGVAFDTSDVRARTIFLGIDFAF